MGFSLYTSKAVEESRHRVIARLRSLNLALPGEALLIKKNGFAIVTRLQSFFNLQFSRELDSSIYELIMNSAIKAEKTSPGGFDSFMQFIIGNVQLPYVKEFKARRSTFSDIDWLLDTFVGVDETLRAIITSALALAGFAGRIFVERSNNSSVNVELLSGYTLGLAPSIQIQPTRLVNARIVCADGYVEEVAEIHHMLEAAASMKEPVLMFVRGMSDDVKHTLSVNYKRGSLRVIPITVPYDLEGINMLADIVVMTGADLVSSNLGQLFSSIDLKAASTVDAATIFSDNVVIRNNATRHSVTVHRKKLLDRRDEQEYEFSTDLIDKRIKLLTPNQVIIRLHDGMNYVEQTQRIDHALRAISALTRHGTMQFNDKKVLTDSIIAGAQHASLCSRQLDALGAIIIDSSVVPEHQSSQDTP